jgi:exopolysaccharide biosynthesis polyprenyl glycosylphosphotransferase
LLLSHLAAAFVLIQLGLFQDLDVSTFLFLESGLLRIFLAAASLIPVMYFLGMYDNVRVKAKYILAENLSFCFGISFMLQAFVSYVRSSYVLGRWMMLLGSLLAFFALIAWRSAYSNLLLNLVGKRKVLFLGNTEMTYNLAKFIEDQPELGYQVVGCADSLEPQSLSGRGPFPGGYHSILSENLQALIEQLQPERIAVSANIENEGELAQQLLWASMKGLMVESIGNLYEDLHNRVALETITINQLVFSSAFRAKSWVTNCQEVYSRLLAALALLITWPLMLLAALAVKLDSEGPALLRQVRLGKGGKPFFFLKFRSMYQDADKLSGPVRAKENDPRITRVGRWIRLTRIDELPQFINVLRGEMFLVGPRPEMPALEEQLLKDIPLYTQRHRVKPGITGWAQIHHTPEDSIDSTRRKLEYDLYYIKTMSPAFDLLIMFYTVKAVALRIGAR